MIATPSRRPQVPFSQCKWAPAPKKLPRSRHLHQCSKNESWQASSSDQDWGLDQAGEDAELKRNRAIWGPLAIALGLVISFVAARFAWTSQPLSLPGSHPPPVKVTPSHAYDEQEVLKSQVSKAQRQTSKPDKSASKEDESGIGVSAVSTAVTTSLPECHEEQQVGAQEASGDNGAGTPVESTAASTHIASRTQEPLLQHLFDDLEQRPEDTAEHTGTSSVSPTAAALDSDGASAGEIGAAAKPHLELGSHGQPSVSKEPTDELAVKVSDINQLGGLTEHEQLQQRASLAVRAAQAALRACESASAHSAASCRSAAEAASAANNATRAASQALSSAERGAAEDLERALRRAQQAQQQARDAEAAAATATSSAAVQSATATEQGQLAQEAASPQIDDIGQNKNISSQVQDWVVRAKVTISAWIQAFSTWSANVWQAFLAWTSRVGERVQQLISKRS